MTRDGPLWLVVLAVSTGASLGACIRWGLSYWLNAKPIWIPMGTLSANLIAGLLIGLALSWFSHHPSINPCVRLFVITGFLGGLSTLSTFSAENLNYLIHGEWLEAIGHIGLHLIGTLVATWIGFEGLTQWYRWMH